MNLTNSYSIINKNRDEIINEWINSEPLSKILKNIKFDKDVYKKDVANPILDYFLNVLLQKEQIGDCPAMRNLVETFLDSGLCVEDVFLNCTIFKNFIVESLFENSINKKEVRQVANILDTNLHKILGIYTEQKVLRQRKSSFHSKLIEEHVALSITDTKGIITYATDAFCELTGYSADELIGKTHSIIKHPDMEDDVFKSMWFRLKKKHKWKGKIKNRKKDGGEFIAKTEIIPYIDENGEVLEYVAIRHDITDKELSNIDPLTDIYNRRYYQTIIDDILDKESELSMMVLDIDHFKKINDKYGHSFGDLVLKEVAGMLCKNLRTKDICIRWGGEEFLILLPETKLEKATDIAQRIRNNIKTISLLERDHQEYVGIKCSIGVTQLNTQDSESSFFNRADKNLYEAKSSGRDMVVSK